MSTYYSEDRPRRHRSQRDRRPRDYTEEETYIARGGVDPRDARRMDLVPRRRDDSVSSVEEIQRDFAPPDGGYVRRKTTVREGVRPARRARSAGRYDDSFYDDRRSEYSGRRRRDKRDYRSRRYDDYSDESSVSRSPPRRRDSMAEKALAALGLGGAAGAIAGHRSRSRSRGPRSYAGSRATSRGRRARSRYSSSRSRSRSRGDVNAKVMQAVKAALAAGAAEAVRARKEPGGWSGDKGKRIITAAIGAAGVDGLIDRDPDKHSKRHIVESALAGLATNRIVNGPRSRSRGPGRGRSTERSQSRGGIKDLAAGGILAAAGKQVFDRVRSKSRGRTNSVSSYSSYDSRSPPRREKKRSKSITDMARKSMAALGIGDAAKEEKRRSRRGSYSSDEDDYPRDVGQPHSMASTSRPSGVLSPTSSRWDTEPRHFGDPNTDSDSDLGSSTDEERKHKKSRNRQMLSAGLATVATIHAAHNLHQSMLARDERHRLVKEGEMSKQEAGKEKTKARLQDLAAVGIAALGIKGAMTEWKDVKDQREEYREEKEKSERHRQKRAARREKLRQMQEQGLLPPGYAGGNAYSNSSFATSAPNLQTPNHSVYNPYIPPQYQSRGPNGGNIIYQDGNPYAASGGLNPSPGQHPGPPAPTPPHQQPLRQQRTGQ